MTHRFLISVATAALIAGGVAANAQGTGGSTGASPSGSMGASPSAGSPSTERGSSGSQMNQSDSPGSSMKSGQSDDKMAPGAKGQRAQEGSQKGSMSSENSKGDSKAGKDMKTEDRKGGEMNRNAGNDRDRPSTTTGQAGAAGQLNSEQRTKITTVIRNQHIQPQTNVNFSISVGTRVPRDVRFHPLPTEIVTVYPDWRGYEFFLVNEQIVVVNPRTMEIVAVLDA